MQSAARGRSVWRTVSTWLLLVTSGCIGEVDDLALGAQSHALRARDAGVDAALDADLWEDDASDAGADAGDAWDWLSMRKQPESRRAEASPSASHRPSDIVCPWNVGTELCNGADDDCDQRVDEGWAPDLMNPRECLGECRARATCTNGAIRCGTPTAEIPNDSGNKDEDCTGGRNDEKSAVSCSDNRDNDLDGLQNCADSDCYDFCLPQGGAACTTTGQCAAGLLCLSATCRVPHCQNGIKDAEEEGLDCGGPCSPCTGQACEHTCRDGEMVTPRALASLRFANGVFTRATGATYHDGDGVLRTVAVNKLRWIDSREQRLALFEGPTTNLLKQSAALNDTTVWVAPTANPMTMLVNADLAPDGTRTAERFTSPNGPARSPRQIVAISPSSNFVLSLYARATTAFEAPTLRGLANMGSPETVANAATWRIYDGWERLDMPVRGSSASGSFGLSHVANWPAAGQAPISTSAFAAWGMQYEPLPFPSSYLPTDGAVSTRAADVLVFEPANVPAWLRNGIWQIDVQPEFSSAELIPATGRTPYHHTIVSFGGTTNISLTTTPGTQAATLTVRSGDAALFAATNLTWSRHDRLRLTFDATAAGKKVTIEGASTGNGTFDAPQLAFPSSGRVRIGGGLDTSGNANGSDAYVALSEPRKVAGAQELCTRDASCTCGDGIVQANETCDPAVGACDEDCVEEGHPDCDEDIDCPNGQDCAEISDRVDGEPGRKYCWPRFCADNPIGFCGDVLSACGKCECVGSCQHAVCGTRTSDGCGQPCFDTCAEDEPGCLDNLDCEGEAVCVWQNGVSHCELPSTDGVGDDYLTPDEDQECDSSCEFCNSSGQCLSVTPVCPNSCPGGCDTEGRCYENGRPTAPRTNSEPVPATGIGQLAGDFSVGADGVARYSVDLAVPPAAANLAPNLTLNYSSSGGDGPIALGWSLSGISAISVCDARVAEDGAYSPHGGPVLCLAGDVLRPVFAQGGPPTQSFQNEPFFYRTRVDEGYIVEGTVDTHEVSRSDLTLGARFVPGTTFKVYKDDGSVLTYGGDEAHLFRGGQDPLMGSNSVRKWLLAQVEDAYGNRIEFRYRKGRDAFAGPAAYEPRLNGFITPAPGQTSVVRETMDTEVVIDRIAYNFDAENVAHSEVKFVYHEDPQAQDVSRADIRTRYWHGGPISNRLTLDRVDMHAVGRLVRSYDLGQVTTEVGRVTLLGWLQECDYDYRGALCFPALRFSYGDPERSDDDEMSTGEGVRYTETFTSNISSLSTQRRDHFYQPHSVVMDGDGDGKDEFYSFHENGSLWKTGEDIEEVTEVARREQFPTFFEWLKEEGINEPFHLEFGAQATDWNKDGLSDILVWGLDETQFRDGENRIHRCRGNNTGSLCGYNNGTGRLWARVPYGMWVYVARQDGEGGVAFDVTRVLTETATTDSTGLAPAAGVATQGVRLNGEIKHPGTDTDAKLSLVDVNRDGLTDVLYCTNSGERGAVAIATGAHLGERWRQSFDESARSNLPTTNFQLHAVQGLDYGFCERAISLSTRTDRTDVWDPVSHKVLTHWRDGLTIFQESVFNGLDMHKHDVRVAELNGDNLPDLIMHHRDDKTGKFFWWFNTGSGFVPGQALGFVPGQAAAPICEMKHLDRAIISDFNNDGLDDFVLPKCGAEDTNKVVGLVVMLARRGSRGVVELGEPEGIKNITPGDHCTNDEAWARNESPFSGFVGDFDGDGDRDLRVVGAEWSNGVSSWNGNANQEDQCGRFPKQQYCCIVDETDNSQKCYLNGDAWTDQCDPSTPGEYDRGTYKYFAQDMLNTTYQPKRPAWYLLSKIASTPVEGRRSSEISVKYAAGAGLESWPTGGPTEACGDLPEMRRSAARSENEGKTVYWHGDDAPCGRVGVSWCAGRLPHTVVSGYQRRTSNGEGGWSDCAGQRLFYSNGQQDAWRGMVGFAKVARLNSVGGAVRSLQSDEFDVSMVPIRSARLAAERDRTRLMDGARVPAVIYPFLSRAAYSSQGDTLPSGQSRSSRTRRKYALLDVQGASGPTNATLSKGSIPDVRALSDDQTSTGWCAFWGGWCGRGQGPTLGLRTVVVVEESDVWEANTKLSGSGTWTSHSALGQPRETFGWSGTSDLRALRERLSGLRGITDVASTRRLTTLEPRTWLTASSGLMEVSSAVATPRSTATATPAWPGRQAFIDLVHSVDSAAFAPGRTTPDVRHAVLTYDYDAKGQLRSTTRDTASGESSQRTLHRDGRGFVERVVDSTNVECEPSCEKTQRIVPDSLGVFVESVEDAKGFVRSFDYDYAHGVPTRVEQADGAVQRSSYDAAGRLEETYVEGLTQHTNVYRSASDMVSVATDDTEGALNVRGLFSESVVRKDSSTGKLSSSYRVFDAAGREVRASQSGLMGTVVWSETEYDTHGRPWRTSRPHKESLDATQGTMRSVYDAVDRVVKVSAPSPTGEGDAWVEYDHGSRVTPGEIDAAWFSGLYAGNTWVTVETTSEESHAQRITGTSVLGRLNMSAQRPATGASEVSLYGYGVGGVLSQVLGPNYDALLRDYDELGRLTRQVDPESGTQAFAYDGFGRLRVATDNGTTRETFYDVLDRPLDESVETDLDPSNVLTTHWEWDRTQQERTGNMPGAAVNRGKLMEVYRSDGFTQRHTYGGVLGQLDSMRRTIPRLGGAGSVDLVVGYTYDTQGRLERTYYPGGWDRTQRLIYNGQGHVQEIVSSGRGRPDQTVWKLTQAHEGQRYERYEVADGRLREQRDYLEGGPSLSGLRSELDGVVVQHDEFGRDDLGRIVRQQRLGVARPVIFKYDPFGRLDKRLNGEGSTAHEVEDFDYSAGGRLLSTRDAILGYENPSDAPKNAVRTLTARQGNESLRYDYHANYGLTASISGTWQGREADVLLHYDGARRLRKMVGEEGEATFSYGLNGERLARRVDRHDGADSFTIYAGKLYEREERADGTTAHVFRFTDGQGQTVFEETIEEPANGSDSRVTGRVLIRDYQGSVLAAAEPNASPDLRTFSSFGTPTGALSDTDLGYTGHRNLVHGLDLGIDLVDMGGRVYDPNSAQFVQPDPTFPSLGSPQGFNRRHYVENDPINFTDPTGFDKCDSNSGQDKCPTGLIPHYLEYFAAKKLWDWAKNPVQKWWTKFKWSFGDRNRREAAGTRFRDGPFTPPAPAAAPLGEGGDRSSATENGPANITYRPVDNSVVTYRSVDGSEPLEMPAPLSLRDMTPVLGPIDGFKASLNAGFDSLLAGDSLGATQNFGFALMNGSFAVFDGVTFGYGGVVTTPARLAAEGGLNGARGAATNSAASAGTFARLRNADGTFASQGGPKRVTGGSHGNTAGAQEAVLYERFDADGNFLKHGITQDLNTRYTQGELNGGYLIETARGPRSEMLKLERNLVETNPGPLNREPWAGARRQ